MTADELERALRERFNAHRIDYRRRREIADSKPWRRLNAVPWPKEKRSRYRWEKVEHEGPCNREIEVGERIRPGFVCSKCYPYCKREEKNHDGLGEGALKDAEAGSDRARASGDAQRNQPGKKSPGGGR
jgi:hypothetical protein